MGGYTLKINGESVTELIRKSIHAEYTLNRKPNTVIMSTALADMLVFEVEGNIYDSTLPRWKKAIGGKIYGLDILIVNNKNHEYIEVLELEK